MSDDVNMIKIDEVFTQILLFEFEGIFPRLQRTCVVNHMQREATGFVLFH